MPLQRRLEKLEQEAQKYESDIVGKQEEVAYLKRKQEALVEKMDAIREKIKRLKQDGPVRMLVPTLPGQQSLPRMDTTRSHLRTRHQ